MEKKVHQSFLSCDLRVFLNFKWDSICTRRRQWWLKKKFIKRNTGCYWAFCQTISSLPIVINSCVYPLVFSAYKDNDDGSKVANENCCLMSSIKDAKLLKVFYHFNDFIWYFLLKIALNVIAVCFPADKATQLCVRNTFLSMKLDWQSCENVSRRYQQTFFLTLIWKLIFLWSLISSSSVRFAVDFLVVSTKSFIFSFCHHTHGAHAISQMIRKLNAIWGKLWSDLSRSENF